MMTPSHMNTRILVIDDEESVRDSFRTILCRTGEDDSIVQSAASVLFDEEPGAHPTPTSLPFEIDTASNGKDGLWMVESAVAKDRPYAAIFIDIRMPGWDGVETAEHIRRVDQRAELVFVTAYSDHSIETIVERAGANIGYFVKPFLTEEVKQLSTKLVLEWNKARELESLVKTIASLRGEAKDMDRLVRHLLSEICTFLDTRSAALVRSLPDGRIDFYMGVGRLESPEQAKSVLEQAKRSMKNGVAQFPDGTAFLPLHEFGLAVALSSKTKLTPDRRYLLEVFLEHAALAVRSSEMLQRLRERERMAAVGEALAYVLHDLKNPLGGAQMMVKLLRAGKTSPERHDIALARIERQISCALDLVHDTLTFCRGGVTIEPQTIYLGSTLEQPLDTWKCYFESRNVEFLIQIPEALSMHADPSWLERVIGNLLQNAAETLAKTKAPSVQLEAREVPDGAEILVYDNGPGVPPEIAENLFEPFTTQGKTEGTGFGLAIVKHVMTAHGGSVRYEREGDKTCFRLYFPKASIAAATLS